MAQHQWILADICKKNLTPLAGGTILVDPLRKCLHFAVQQGVRRSQKTSKAPQIKFRTLLRCRIYRERFLGKYFPGRGPFKRWARTRRGGASTRRVLRLGGIGADDASKQWPGCAFMPRPWGRNQEKKATGSLLSPAIQCTLGVAHPPHR